MKEVKMKTEDETQTFCEWICTESNCSGMSTWVAGQVYYFHEDQYVSGTYFLPVIDSEGVPIYKTVRIDK